MLSLPNERLGLVDDGLVEQPFTPLRTALHTRKQVTFAYLGRNDTTPKRRHVDPVRIHVLDGNWYLEAFDHDRQAGRIFLIDRIADVDVLEATAENHQFLDLTPTYEPNDSDTTVVLHVTPQVQWVLDQLVFTDTQTHEDGSITGKPGAVLVGERELKYREVDDLRKLWIGEAAQESAFKAMASTVVLPGGGKFQRILVRREVGQVVVQVWERVG
jgi:hypothetical protein